MNAEIISIGTELLLGHIVNTNSAFLSQKLAEIGIDVYHASVIGDNRQRLAQSIRRALNRSDIIITTGGLGPTVDDITIETLAEFLGKRLVLNKAVLNDVKTYFRHRKVKFPKESLRQAYLPEDVKWIRNKAGTAPGLIATISYRTNELSNKRTIICLPGPPRELEPMFVNNIIPYLTSLSDKKSFMIKTRTIKTTGLAESQVNGLVKDLLRLKPPTTVGIYAKPGQVELKIMSKAANSKKCGRAISVIQSRIRSRLKDHIFGYDDQTLEDAVAAILTKKRLTLAVAESCTGGLISHRLTNVTGASGYFLMGLVAYNNEIKELLLAVPEETLARHGAVSRKVALEMTEGVRSLASSNIGLGITGIAGPTGGTKRKPVGLVYIALSIGGRKTVKEFRFKGSREDIKSQASQAALDMIRRNI